MSKRNRKPARSSLAKDERFVLTAREHRDADHRCGRKWVCGCAACLAVRSRILKGEVVPEAPALDTLREACAAALAYVSEASQHSSAEIKRTLKRAIAKAE